MTERPAWVPDDVTDGEIEYFQTTAAGMLAHAEWLAKEIGDAGLLARIDQTRAAMREGFMSVIRQHFSEGDQR